MDPSDVILLVLAGLAAGAINAIAGGGSLITFPALITVGLPPVTANVSNTLGLVPGSLSGAFGYRRELSGQIQKRNMHQCVLLVLSRCAVFGSAARP